jgi:glycosyltransferase involved in cell wall biosynthesis
VVYALGRNVRLRFFNTYEPVNSFYRDLLPRLVELGCCIEILISVTAYRGGRVPLRDSLASSGVRTRHVGPRLSWGAGGRVQRLVAQAAYAATTAFSSLFGGGTDLNVFLTQPPLLYSWGYALKLLRGQRYVVIVMDLYPEVAFRAGVLRASGLTARCLQRLSRFVLSRATGVVVLGRCMEDVLRRGGVPPSRIRVIPNWSPRSDTRSLKPAPHLLREQLGLEDRFTVLYSGNLGRGHYFDDLLDVAGRLRSIGGIQFVIVGEGARKQEILCRTQSEGLQNVSVLPFQPADSLSAILSLGDVHFVSLRRGFEGLMVPSKAYAAFAAGRPIIYQGDASGEIARLVQEERVGVFVPLGDSQALEGAILRYFSDGERAKRDGERALALSSGRCGFAAALQAYEELFLEAGSG